VYGTLLNFRREWDLWSPRMTQDPHKAAPKAPVLYVKTANTFCPAGQDLLLQDGVSEVDIGATLGLVICAQAQVVGAVLLNDWSVPHTSYYRPPVKFRCREAFWRCRNRSRLARCRTGPRCRSRCAAMASWCRPLTCAS